MPRRGCVAPPKPKRRNVGQGLNVAQGEGGGLMCNKTAPQNTCRLLCWQKEKKKPTPLHSNLHAQTERLHRSRTLDNGLVNTRRLRRTARRTDLNGICWMESCGCLFIKYFNPWVRACCGANDPLGPIHLLHCISNQATITVWRHFFLLSYFVLQLIEAKSHFVKLTFE